MSEPAEDESPALHRPPRKPKGKKKRKRRGRPSPLREFFSTNRDFLMTRVLPVGVLAAVFLSAGLYITYQRWASRASEKLAQTLWDDIRGAPTEATARPYVRGELAILETQLTVDFDLQDHGQPGNWLNDHVEAPLDAPESIGSVVLVEWHVFGDVARDSSGREMGVRNPLTGKTSGPAMLKRWSCYVKLIDRKRRCVVYVTQLQPGDRTIEEGDAAIGTPSTRVTQAQLAEEFDKILEFPRIAMADEPPGDAQE